MSRRHKTASHRSEANYARAERRHNPRGTWAGFAARKARRADRHAGKLDARDALAGVVPVAFELDSDALDAVCGEMPAWMA